MRAPSKTQQKFEERVLESLYSEAPDRDSKLKVTVFGEAENQPIRYYVYADVLRELVKAARFRSESATAILTGQFRMDRDGPFIEVTAFRDLKYLYGEDPVEMTRPSIESAMGEMEGEDDEMGRHVVGVFMARPGGEALLDNEAARLHLSLFNMPFQVMAVIDGTNDRLGLYARARREPFFNAAFHLVEAGSSNADNESKMEPINDENGDRRTCSEGDSR